MIIEVLMLALAGSMLAWWMMPPALHPDVRVRLRWAIPRRVRAKRLKEGSITWMKPRG